jgi:hypothetical protein
MKRTVKSLLYAVLIFSMLISLVACFGDDSDTNSYSEAGLAFTLPKDMERLSVSSDYADVAFGNVEGAEFFIYYYSRDELLTRLYFANKDATSLEYAEWFTNLWSYPDVRRDYDEENNVVIQSYVYEGDFYTDYITRNYEVLFHVTMCCDVSLREKYEPIFEEWMATIYIDMD